ncbi:MAG: N-acetylmuramoyl-L-alanine amidase [Lachnospiraceae bacterium]|nr:N-acetylmuramoyl-L-alanine amidase [Lachnospiraceae bacterium]
MKNDQLKTACICTAVLSVICIAVCLWHSANKPIAIAVQAQTAAEESVSITDSTDGSRLIRLSLSEAAGDGDDIDIPLPSGVASESIRTENLYLTGELLINILADGSRYEQEDPGILARSSRVSECTCEVSENSCSLRFALTGVYEPQMSLSDGVLHIRLQSPAELYEHIVLIDPVPSAGADMTLETAQALENLYQTDPRIHVYLTRTGADRQDETALRLLQETGADFLVRLETQSASEQDSFRVIYNGSRYLRRYTNAELARDLASGIAADSGRMFTDLDASPDGDILLNAAEIPAATVLMTGNTQNSASWLTDKKAPAKIAAGIARALTLASDTMESRTVREDSKEKP